MGSYEAELGVGDHAEGWLVFEKPGEQATSLKKRARFRDGHRCVSWECLPEDRLHRGRIAECHQGATGGNEGTSGLHLLSEKPLLLGPDLLAQVYALAPQFF